MKVANLWAWNILLLQAIHTEVKDVTHEGVVLVFLLLHNCDLGPSSIHLPNRPFYTIIQFLHQGIIKYLVKLSISFIANLHFITPPPVSCHLGFSVKVGIEIYCSNSTSNQHPQPAEVCCQAQPSPN